MSLIGVIVPVYKVEKYLRRCVDSILDQTFSDFELILVNDGSPDNCPAICDEYAKKDRRVHVIHQENGGISSARNAGVAHADCHCSCKWVTFVDSDDQIHPQMLQLLFDAVTSTGADISMCGALEAEELPIGFFDHRSPNISFHTVNEEYILDIYKNGKHRYWTAWAKLIRIEYALSMPFELGKVYEDNNIVFKWLSSAQAIADIHEDLYFYLINTSGISKRDFSLKKLDYLYALKNQMLFYSEKKYDKLHGIVCKLYINNLVDMYAKVRDILCDKKAARKLKRDACAFWIKGKNRRELSKNDKLYTLDVFFPKCMQIYWLKKRCDQIINSEGIKGLLVRIGKKIK